MLFNALSRNAASIKHLSIRVRCAITFCRLKKILLVGKSTHTYKVAPRYKVAVKENPLQFVHTIIKLNHSFITVMKAISVGRFEGPTGRPLLNGYTIKCRCLILPLVSFRQAMSGRRKDTPG